MTLPESIVLVGTGNVASHLAEALGGKIKSVISRDAARAKVLADRYGITNHGTYSDIAGLKPDMLIISVADHAITEVVETIGHIDGNPLAVHTSGTVSKDSLAPLSTRRGVLYPLQTFSKDVFVDMSGVPFFTEATDTNDIAIIDAVASQISKSVYHADESQRQLLHIAGVFSSNFVNVIIEMVQDILAEGDYPLSTVKPLVEATIDKAFKAGPHAAQTGPARRGDSAVMHKHAAALPPSKRAVYELLSQYIIQSQNVTLK